MATTSAIDESGDVTGDLEAQLTRHEAIWAGLYGPPRAKELVEEVRAHLASDSSIELSALVAELDPDDEDWEEGGLARPGVG